MNAIFQIALSNAAIVTLAAPAVWAVSRVLRKPALSHALWLIVLVKFITPPLWTAPLSIPPWHSSQLHLPGGAIEIPLPSASPPQSSHTESENGPVPVEFEPNSARRHPIENESEGDVSQFPAHRSWQSLLAGCVESLWLVGSGFCLVIAMVRTICFARMLRYANAAGPDVQQRAAILARRLRFGAAPDVWFIPGTLCPMLWTLGRSTRLLIPHGLWEQLDPARRDTILLHELAHWRRRDHWVRWIELLATSLYWWHPVCWWARRELREAEEQCCDAWVLWALPGAFHDYANALLEAVEFISIRAERPFARCAVPALASGMGQFVHLKRRLIMLKNGNVARGLSWGGFAAAFGLAALLLPISPIVAQEISKFEEKAATVKVGDEASRTDSNSLNGQLTREDVFADDANTSVRKLDAAKKEIAELRRKLEEAEARLALIDKTDTGRAADEKKAKPTQQTAVHSSDGKNWIVTPDPKTFRQTQQTVVSSSDGKYWIVTTDPKTGREIERVPSEKAWVRTEVKDGKYRTVVTDPATGRIKEIREDRIDADSMHGQADRLDRIEAELRDLLREVQNIKSQTPGTDKK
jgi:beta-lactamase regulating signal transducer with metallopeptidase domain